VKEGSGDVMPFNMVEQHANCSIGGSGLRNYLKVWKKIKYLVILKQINCSSKSVFTSQKHFQPYMPYN